MSIIPKGYKASALGIIPVNWEVKELHELGKFRGGGTPDTQNEAYWNGDIPWISSSDLVEGNIRFIKTSRYLTEEAINKSATKIIPEKSVLIVSRVGVGKVAVNESPICTSQDFLNLIVEKGNYIFLALSIQLKTKQLLDFNQGTSIKGFVKDDISKLSIPIPPIKEQKAIADALTLVDYYISTTNQLISKKELQKKALMQQLLTGKKRLRGFENAWDNVPFDDAFIFIKSYSISRDGLKTDKFVDDVYCIHYGDIHAFYENEFLDFSSQKRIPQIIDKDIKIKESDYLEEGDIILADASEDYNGVGEAVEVLNIQTKKAVGGLHTIVLRGINYKTANGFRAYLFASEKLRNELRKKATGTSVYSVTKTTIESLFFELPSIIEQNAIAHILIAADKEIQLLKSKADKLKEQKKGMMQQLLTGKKRLKLNEI